MFLDRHPLGEPAPPQPPETLVVDRVRIAGSWGARAGHDRMEGALDATLAELSAIIAKKLTSTLAADVKHEMLSALEDVIDGPQEGNLHPWGQGHEPGPGRKRIGEESEKMGDLAQQGVDRWPIPRTVGAGDSGYYVSETGSGLSDLPPASTDGVYEGTVKLRVQAERSAVLPMVHFVSELRRRAELRVLNVVRNEDGGADILVGLRLPLPMRRVLQQIDSVSDVRPLAREGIEPLLNVQLKAVS